MSLHTEQKEFNIEIMQKECAHIYRLLAFQEIYDALNNGPIFTQVVNTGWFPFIEITGGDFEQLLRSFVNNFNIEGEEKILLTKFDKKRIEKIASRWWSNQALASRKDILQPALLAFMRGDPVSCMKNLLTEIEGILRDRYKAEVGSNAGLDQVLQHAIQRGSEKGVDENSLFFSKPFLNYLNEVVFANFDPNTVGETGAASRHSVGHGMASSKAYTQERALQAILTVDQIGFYLA